MSNLTSYLDTFDSALCDGLSNRGLNDNNCVDMTQNCQQLRALADRPSSFVNPDQQASLLTPLNESNSQIIGVQHQSDASAAVDDDATAQAQAMAEIQAIHGVPEEVVSKPIVLPQPTSPTGTWKEISECVRKYCGLLFLPVQEWRLSPANTAEHNNDIFRSLLKDPVLQSMIQRLCKLNGKNIIILQIFDSQANPFWTIQVWRPSLCASSSAGLGLADAVTPTVTATTPTMDSSPVSNVESASTNVFDNDSPAPATSTAAVAELNASTPITIAASTSVPQPAVGTQFHPHIRCYLMESGKPHKDKDNALLADIKQLDNQYALCVKEAQEAMAGKLLHKGRQKYDTLVESPKDAKRISIHVRSLDGSKDEEIVPLDAIRWDDDGEDEGTITKSSSTEPDKSVFKPYQRRLSYFLGMVESDTDASGNITRGVSRKTGFRYTLLRFQLPAKSFEEQGEGKTFQIVVRIDNEVAITSSAFITERNKDKKARKPQNKNANKDENAKKSQTKKRKAAEMDKTNEDEQEEQEAASAAKLTKSKAKRQRSRIDRV